MHHQTVSKYFPIVEGSHRQPTIEQGVDNIFPVPLDKVVDIAKDSAWFWSAHR